MGAGNDFLGFPLRRAPGFCLDGAHWKAPHSQESPTLSSPWLCPGPPIPYPAPGPHPKPQYSLAPISSTPPPAHSAPALAPQFLSFIFGLNALSVLFFLQAFAQAVPLTKGTVLPCSRQSPTPPPISQPHLSLQPHSDEVRGIRERMAGNKSVRQGERGCKWVTEKGAGR